MDNYALRGKKKAKKDMIEESTSSVSPKEGEEEIQKEVQAVFSRPCTFLTSVYALDTLPTQNWPEVAFAGRSNVGKSSLINALFNHKGLAKTSSTPGRTQSLNFFNLGDILYVVDMPGYGYAEAPKSLVADWNKLLRTYLKGRPQLKRVFLLIDARHGLKDNDMEIMKMLDEAAVSYQIILTKEDKVKKDQVETVRYAIEKTFKEHPALHPNVLVSSSEKKTGVESIRRAVASLMVS